LIYNNERSKENALPTTGGFARWRQ